MLLYTAPLGAGLMIPFVPGSFSTRRSPKACCLSGWLLICFYDTLFFMALIIDKINAVRIKERNYRPFTTFLDPLSQSFFHNLFFSTFSQTSAKFQCLQDLSAKMFSVSILHWSYFTFSLPSENFNTFSCVLSLSTFLSLFAHRYSLGFLFKAFSNRFLTSKLFLDLFEAFWRLDLFSLFAFSTCLASMATHHLITKTPSLAVFCCSFYWPREPAK